MFLVQKVHGCWVGSLLFVAEANLIKKRAKSRVVLWRHLESDKYSANVCAMIAVVEQTYVPLTSGLTALTVTASIAVQLKETRKQ